MIAAELKELVSNTIKELGKTLREVYGEDAFQLIEKHRVMMKHARGKDRIKVKFVLDKLYKELKDKNDKFLHQEAKAFSLMLELTNACEAAYRVFRLGKYKIENNKYPESIIFVFTSHPTESRSQHFLKVIRKIEGLLIKSLHESFDSISSELNYFLKIAVMLDLANQRRPKVRDEMEEIFQIVLRPEILKEQLSLREQGINVSFRTWVGGDKDGHPKVGPETLLESLQYSRLKLVEFILTELKIFEDEVSLLKSADEVSSSLQDLKKNIIKLKRLSPNDGKRIVEFKKEFKKLCHTSLICSLDSPFLSNLKNLLWNYPALVLPLEIREDKDIIHAAILDDKIKIAQMLKALRSISKGMDPKWYVRGFIVSMCQHQDDILAALKLTKRELQREMIPVVPLFENEEGLIHVTDILKGAFENSSLVSLHQKKWGSRFEVMIGYSDSSKENGVLPARLMIENAIYKIEKFLMGQGLISVFFHGSGGSTGRGGGTVEEQTSWWPKSALNIYKVTVQGEMVQRNFGQPRIMRSQTGKIVRGFQSKKSSRTKKNFSMNTFCSLIQKEYKSLVSNPDFHELLSFATPYDYLNLLKIGSRPSKRNLKGKFSLRAIPWIMCWTQTRILIPVWWGVGSAWKNLSQSDKSGIKNEYKSSPLFQSYVKNLGFTLAKVEIGVWNFNLLNSNLSKDQKKYWSDKIFKEFEDTLSFLFSITKSKNLTWFRPWLGESIYFRSSMIHPLNVIQKLALERRDPILLRETVTGIACGMLTTG